MEEEKKSALTDIEKVRQEILTSTKTDLELLNSARVGTKDYDFDSVKIIKEGGQSIVFEIKCKINGKTYAAKRLHYRIGSKYNEKRFIAEAEREISFLRVLKHPMIMKMIDLVKDEENNPWIIMQKYSQNLTSIVNDYKEGLLPEQKILRIFTMICIPLFHIHSKKIVHRDFRPDNILLKTIGNL